MAYGSFAATVASSSLSRSSASLPPKKHDVFISFRGEDTRETFTSHLEDALRRTQIETFVDNRLVKGDEVWPALVEAIKDSYVFVVIFSEDYASSTWCLNELLEIMECKKKGHDVIPVFYRTDPSHVRKQTGSYKAAFDRHEQDSKHSRNKVRNWRAALTQIANISGFDSRLYRTDSRLVKDIIKAVLPKLNHRYPSEQRVPCIFNQNYADVESLLRTESKEVQIIGIWGMGGIGKTTIATVIFHNISSQYEGSCFLANVREESNRHGLSHLCSRLLSELLGEKNLRIDTPKVISSFVMSRLRRKKVLIVLDDVNTSELLENLVGTGCGWLGAGSRIIVTTRDKQVLISGGVHKIHEVKAMNFQDSLLLFSFYAFKKTHPENGYEELSKRALVYANGIPLALKVLGSFLRSKSEKEWDSALRKLKKIPNPEIRKVLRLSLDELDISDKNIFLDIACFFKGWDRDHTIRLLDACGFFADIGIRNLLDKALITIFSHNIIEMHDLIQEMGRDMIREESIKNPGGRSRLWDSEEIRIVFENDRGTNAVEGIFLYTTEIADLNLNSHAFEKMPNLRLLNFYVDWMKDKETRNYVSCPTGLESMPNNLRHISWDACPLKSLPSTFVADKLVELTMIGSNLEKLWNGVQNLPNLERLSLGGSARLMELPDLSRAPNLKDVWLTDCESLSQVHPSIFSLQKLESLYMSGCEALRSLPSTNLSASVQLISAHGCSNLQEFSVTADHYTGALHLQHTAINELPSSILHLRNLSYFGFSISESLMDLPENFTHHLELFESRQHQHDALIVLRTLLQHSSGFQYVRHLSLYLGHTLSELPDNISLLSSLEELSLFGSHLISLPESIKFLPRLKHVDLRLCEKLQSLPALPQSIQSLQAGGCKSLKAMSSGTLMSGPPRKQKCTFLFQNCLELNQDALNTILKDAIELGAKALSTIAFEDVVEDEDEGEGEDDDEDEDEDESEDEDEEELDGNNICFCFPAKSIKVVDWLHYCSTLQTSVKIEQFPPNSKFFGFIFCVVISQVPSIGIEEDIENLGCECCLETSSGERVHITSSFVYPNNYGFHLTAEFGNPLLSDHVYLWYDAECCQQIMESVEESEAINDVDERTTYNPKLTFKFFALKEHDEEVGIKECGVRFIYPSEDQIVEQGNDGSKSKRSREIHELEEAEPGPSAIPIGIEDPEEHKDELQEPLPVPVPLPLPLPVPVPLPLAVPLPVPVPVPLPVPVPVPLPLPLPLPQTKEFRLIINLTMRSLVSLMVLLVAVFTGFLFTNSLQQTNSSHEPPPT